MSFTTLVDSAASRQLTSTDVTSMFGQYNQVKIARVGYILLTQGDTKEEQEKFKKYGEWNGLGTIEYYDITSRTDVDQEEVSSLVPTGTARPLFPNSKTLPLLNELVYIITTTVPDIDTNELLPLEYYVSIVNLWNNPSLNAWPGLKNSKSNFPENTPGGLNVRRPSTTLTSINLGKSFKERINIHPLRLFEGDSVYEGRWGNSIRLGSTNKLNSNNSALNTWSRGTSNSGDPIILIRNGQSEEQTKLKQGWTPVEESLNGDLSSIYLTSTQQLNLTPASSLTVGYSTQYPAPTPITTFTNPQIVLNSSRVILNSTSDSIILTSKKSIALSSRETVNLYSPQEIILESKNIMLGGVQDLEPVLKGDKTVELLTILLKELQALTSTLSTLTVPTSEGPVPITSVQEAAGSVNRNLTALLNNSIPTLKSIITFTK